MEICINYGGRRHCFFLPVLEFPVNWGRPGPGPVNYPALFQDAILLASVSNAVKQITDENVRKFLQAFVDQFTNFAGRLAPERRQAAA